MSEFKSENVLDPLSKMLRENIAYNGTDSTQTRSAAFLRALADRVENCYRVRESHIKFGPNRKCEQLPDLEHCHVDIQICFVDSKPGEPK